MIKKFFLKGLLLLGGMFLLFNCQQDDFVESVPSVEHQDEYIVNKISFKEVKENGKAFQKLKEARTGNTSFTGRGVFNEDYGVFVDTTNIMLIEKDDSRSITFQIINENSDTEIQNLILNSVNGKEYKAYIATYVLSQEELGKILNDETLGAKLPSSVTEFNQFARGGVLGDGADCIDVYTYTQYYCTSNEGKLIKANGEVDGRCKGMSWPVEQIVYKIAGDCMSSGGLHGPDMPTNPGSPNTGTPGGTYVPGSNNPGNSTPGTGTNPNNPATPPTNPGNQIHDPGNGPIITTPLLQLDASKAFYNNLDSGQKQWWNNAVNSIAKREILTYLEEDTYSEESKAFGKWAIDYLKANPSVTIEQFENRFMGTSDGQDGEYDSAYWDNPNLTFPPQSLPTWNNFKAAFPLDKDPLYDTALKMLNSIGGEVANFYNGPETNTCAFRLSKALNYSGVVIPNIPGQTFKGRDNKYYFKAAYQINLWMRKTFGTSPTNPNHYSITGAEAGVHGVELPTLLSEIKGIYSLYSSDFTWASGHADLLYPDATCGNNCHFYDAPIHRIDVWELN